VRREAGASGLGTQGKMFKGQAGRVPRGNGIMKRIKSQFIFSTAAIIIFLSAQTAQADLEKIDRLLGEFDQLMPKVPVVLTLDDCLAAAIENNHELRIKMTILNSVVGDDMIDRSRFYSHVDFLADFSRDQGSLLKSFYPSHNPLPVSSLGALDTSSLSMSSKSSGGSVGGFDISSLAGIDMSQISSMASQYGIDISQFLPRMAASPAEQRIARKSAEDLQAQIEKLSELIYRQQQVSQMFSHGAPAAAQRSAGATTNPCETLPQPQRAMCEALYPLVQSVIPSTSGSSDRTKGHTQVAMRYSRRLIEWGKDSSSSVQIRANRRLAIYNYQQKLREVISNVRTTFFTILLKKQQIATREKLLKEYEKKLWQQQKRFEVARDVPRIDVLTAELDVLNERDRISSLQADLVEKKYELLQLIDMPLDTNIDFTGELPSFDYSLREIVRITKDKSFNISYLKEELKEDQREFDELAWDYKPVFSAQIGIENRRTAMGMTVNNSNQTYGLDLGVSQFANLPSSSELGSFSSSGREDHNYTLNAGVIWNVFDNTQRKGVKKKYVENLNETRIDLDRQMEIEELTARKAYNNLKQAEESLKIQESIVEIARRRLEITRKLREYDKVPEYQVDSYRDNFFSQQDRYFSEQETLIQAQENLRRVMGLFE